MERKILKSHAKSQIKGNIGILFVIALLSWLCTVAVVCIPVAGFLINLFLSSGFLLAMSSIYLGICGGKRPRVADLFGQMRNCLHGFCALFLVGLYTFLWSLLFIVPGIINSIAYSQTMFILSERPGIGARAAIGRSKIMMKGHKMEYFLLQLSFIGWGLLGISTLGLLYIWLIPYMNAANANFYLQLKKESTKETAAVNTSTAAEKIPPVYEPKQETSRPMQEETVPDGAGDCPSGMTPQDAMVETLRKHGELSLEALKRECPAVRDLTDSRISALLTQDSRVGSNYRVRTKFYFALPERDPQEIERENERYEEAILEYVNQNGARTVEEIADNCVAVMSLPTQRVSALAQKLHEEGKLRRTGRNGKLCFESPTAPVRPGKVRAESVDQTLQSIEEFLSGASDSRRTKIAETNMLDFLHVSGITSPREFFKVQVLAARIGLEAGDQLSAKQERFASTNLSKFYKGPMKDIFPMLTGEVAEEEYKAIEDLCAAGSEKTTIPLLTYILSFAYSDGTPSPSLEEKLKQIIQKVL